MSTASATLHKTNLTYIGICYATPLHPTQLSIPFRLQFAMLFFVLCRYNVRTFIKLVYITILSYTYTELHNASSSNLPPLYHMMTVFGSHTMCRQHVLLNVSRAHAFRSLLTKLFIILIFKLKMDKIKVSYSMELPFRNKQITPFCTCK